MWDSGGEAVSSRPYTSVTQSMMASCLVVVVVVVVVSCCGIVSDRHLSSRPPFAYLKCQQSQASSKRSSFHKNRQARASVPPASVPRVRPASLIKGKVLEPAGSRFYVVRLLSLWSVTSG